MTLYSLRKLIFSKSLERSAKDEAVEIAKTARFWFRKKYGLPPTDPRYLDMTDQAMLTEYWAHYYYDKPESEYEGGTDNYDDELAAMDAALGIANDDDFEDISK